MSPLPTRIIAGTQVSAIGLGLMNIAGAYSGFKTDPDEERFALLDAAFEKGCTFWDSADVYGDSEDLIGKWFKRTGKRNKIFLATKFGFVIGDPTRAVNGDPEYVKKAAEKSLQRLGVETIDLYYLHRADSTVPIERTVGAMAELVKEGRVKHIGLSEVSAATLRRAHAVHPIAAVQVEYSPITLDIEDEKIGLYRACQELGVAVVAYSPLGRGVLTGQIRSLDDLEADDWRRTVPRYSKESFPNITQLANGLKAIGEEHGATAGQVALAWLLAQGPNVIPIPGTRKIKYLEENLAAAALELSTEELARVREVAEHADVTVQGDRYPPGMMDLIFAETPALSH